MLGLVGPHQHALDPAVLHLGAVERGFEQQRDIRLAHHLVIEQQIPELPAALRIVGGIVEPEFLKQSGLPPSQASFVTTGAHDVHLHFARGIAAQPRTILYQDHLGAMPRGGHRCADAGHAAARHEQVGLQVHQRHVRFQGWIGRGSRLRGDPLEIGPDLRIGSSAAASQDDQRIPRRTVSKKIASVHRTPLLKRMKSKLITP